MNQKITPRIIKIIALQSVLVIIALTAIGGAALVHGNFKSASDPNAKPSKENVTEAGDTQKPETTETLNPEDYEYGYAGFFPKTTDMTADVSKIIINGNYCLPEDYVPPVLEEIVKGTGVTLDNRAAPYYRAMYDAALEDDIILTPVSGYRSYDRQKKNFEDRIKQNMNDGMDKKEATIEAAKVIMLPGASEHNAGLAVDICSLSESFENYDEFKWLQEHAAEYGFILRYPKDEAKQKITGVVYEPWHYRFVGKEAAYEITSKGITLEEYLGLN